MNVANQDHMAAVIVLVGALLATVIALSGHSEPTGTLKSASRPDLVAPRSAADVAGQPQ